MQVLHLDNLPEFARRELLDFYQFLVRKYSAKQTASASPKPPIAPRLVKPFKI